MRIWVTLCLLALFPDTARSGAPSTPQFPGTCSRVPGRIVLVGTDGARPDARLGSFEVAVCRFTNPLPGAVVHVALSGAPGGVRLGRDADPPPISTLCPGDLLGFQADANGLCRITVSGSVDVSQQVPGVAPTVDVYANGVLFGSIPVICFDLDGADGIGANDLSRWLALFGSGEPILVADFNGSGTLDADDLSLWLDAFGGGDEAVSAVPLCP